MCWMVKIIWVYHRFTPFDTRIPNQKSPCYNIHPRNLTWNLKMNENDIFPIDLSRGAENFQIPWFNLGGSGSWDRGFPGIISTFWRLENCPRALWADSCHSYHVSIRCLGVRSTWFRLPKNCEEKKTSEYQRFWGTCRIHGTGICCPICLLHVYIKINQHVGNIFHIWILWGWIMVGLKCRGGLEMVQEKFYQRRFGSRFDVVLLLLSWFLGFLGGGGVFKGRG